MGVLQNPCRRVVGGFKRCSRMLLGVIQDPFEDVLGCFWGSEYSRDVLGSVWGCSRMFVGVV